MAHIFGVKKKFLERYSRVFAGDQMPASRHRFLIVVGLAAAVASAVVSPAAYRGTPLGHDFYFHATSWLEIASQWKHGNLAPGWAALANHGWGEPRFIFYPPLSYWLGGTLVSLLPARIALVIFLWLSVFGAGLAMYFLAKRCLSEQAAWVNPYLVLTMYRRSAYAELMALMFFPVLLLSLCDLFSAKRENVWSKVAVCGFVMALIWLTNVPAAILSTYALLFLCTCMAVIQRSYRLLVYGISSLLLGLVLAAFHLGPAFFEKRFVQTGYLVDLLRFTPACNFLFMQCGNPAHYWFTLLVSFVGLGMLGATTLAVFLSRGEITKPPAESARVSLSLLLLFAMCGLAAVRISLPLWNYLPELRYVQFPWRVLGLLAVPFSFFLARLCARSSRWWLWTLPVLVTLAAADLSLVNRSWASFDPWTSALASFQSGEGYDGQLEYLPVGVDGSKLPVGAPAASFLPADGTESPAQVVAVNPSTITIDQWTAGEKVFRVASVNPARIALSLLNYFAWRVTMDGQTIRAETSPETGAMIVPVSPGTHLLVVRFDRTADRNMGLFVSCVGFVLFLGLLRPAKRQSAAGEPLAVCLNSIRHPRI
jgi:hypothetical protein